MDALQDLNKREYLNIIDNVSVLITDKLLIFAESLLKEERAKQDINRIMYFTEIISSYSEDVILSYVFQ